MRKLLVARAVTLAFCGTVIPSAMITVGAYPHDGNGKPVRRASSLCWHTGHWSPADAATGCDGELTSPIDKHSAPDFSPTPSALNAVSPLMVPTAKRFDFRIAANSTNSFGFGQDHLSATEKKRLMAEFRQKVTTCGVIESVTVGAHTERLGKKFVNYKLSERRVAPVAAEIMHIASNAPIDIKEFGSAQQVMQCAKQRAKKNVAHCPAPNRRTMIDAQEIAN